MDRLNWNVCENLIHYFQQLYNLSISDCWKIPLVISFYTNRKQPLINVSKDFQFNWEKYSLYSNIFFHPPEFYNLNFKRYLYLYTLWFYDFTALICYMHFNFQFAFNCFIRTFSPFSLTLCTLPSGFWYFTTGPNNKVEQKKIIPVQGVSKKIEPK